MSSVSPPPRCRSISTEHSSAVLPQNPTGIKETSFLKGKQHSLCDHLLCPFFLHSSLKRQGAICRWTKARCSTSSHPDNLRRQTHLYISRLLLVCCRHTLCRTVPRRHVCIFWRNAGHNGKYPHLPCHSGERQAFPDKASAQKAHSAVLLLLCFYLSFAIALNGLLLSASPSSHFIITNPVFTDILIFTSC